VFSCEFCVPKTSVFGTFFIAAFAHFCGVHFLWWIFIRPLSTAICQKSRLYGGFRAAVAGSLAGLLILGFWILAFAKAEIAKTGFWLLQKLKLQKLDFRLLKTLANARFKDWQSYFHACPIGGFGCQCLMQRLLKKLHYVLSCGCICVNPCK